MSSSGKLDVISNAFRPDRFGPNVSAQQRSKGVHPTGYAARAPQLSGQSQIVVFWRGCATSRLGPAGIDVLAVLPPRVLEIR